MMRIFYEFIFYINTYRSNNFKNKNLRKGERIKVGTIIGGISLLFIISLILILNIEYIIKYLHIDFINAYYLCISIILIMQMICLILLNLNDAEKKFINELLILIMTLNCWNFISINIGVGLFMSIIILPLEYLFIHLQNNNIIKISILFYLIFSTLKIKELIFPLVFNYINYKNNTYIIISGSIFFLSLRMELFIITLINNIYRKRKNNKEKEQLFNEKLIVEDKIKMKKEENKSKIE